MKSELIKLGPFTVHGYGLMIAIGIMAAYMVAEYRAKKQKLNYELIFNLTVWCLVGGILGAKVLYYVTQLKEIISNPKVLLDVTRGFVVYGGIIGGIFAGYLFCKKQKISFLKYFDLVMPSIALAQGFGRLGCFLAGCCYGIETKSHFGIVFPHSEYAPSGVNLVPTQLMSSGLNFLHFLALIIIAKRKKADGQIAGFYLIFYSAGRFILEFFRGDIDRGSVGALSTSQFIAIFMFIIGWIIVLVRANATKNIGSDLTDDEIEEYADEEFDEELDEDETSNETIADLEKSESADENLDIEYETNDELVDFNGLIDDASNAEDDPENDKENNEEIQEEMEEESFINEDILEDEWKNKSSTK